MSEELFNDRGELTRDMVVSGVAMTKGMTATQRSEAVAKATTGGTYKPTSHTGGPPLEWQTEETAQKLRQGESAGKSPDHEALDATFRDVAKALKAKGLPEAEHNTKYSALRGEYERQLGGVFAREMARAKAPPPSAR